MTSRQRFTPEFKLDTAKLMVEKQNDFYHERGYYAQNMGLDVTMTRALKEPINRLTAAVRSSS